MLCTVQYDMVFENLYVWVVYKVAKLNETLVQLRNVLLVEDRHVVTLLDEVSSVNIEYGFILLDIENWRINVAHRSIFLDDVHLVFDRHSHLRQFVGRNLVIRENDIEHFCNIRVVCIRHKSVTQLRAVSRIRIKHITCDILLDNINIDI